MNDDCENNQSTLATSTLTALEEKQQLLAHHVRLVARSMGHALFVFGAQGGLGKSRTILRTLDDECIVPVIINSHITPLSLFATLYRFRDDQVIFFDDVDSMFSSMAHLGLLRSALWGNPRLITYGSSQMPDDLPSSFEFTSRCIFAANVIPSRNDAFKAVLSRCDIFELSATNDEVIDLMRSISCNGFSGLTQDDCFQVIDFIAKNAHDRQLSMRLLGPSLRKLQYARSEGLDWRPMVMSQLHTLGKKNAAIKQQETVHQDLQRITEAIERFPQSVKDQQLFWSKQTGKSRASFFRCLSVVRQRQTG